MTIREREVRAALAVGLSPSSYRRLPKGERYEVEAYLYVQDLKEVDKAKRERQAQQDAQRKAEGRKKMRRRAPRNSGGGRGR